MVGVCIKYFHENYGGMLQAFATISFLERLGVDYELIQYQKKLTLTEKIKSIPRLLNCVLLNDKYESMIKKLGEKRYPQVAEKNLERIKSFGKFNQEYFTKLSPVYVGYKGLCQGAMRYTAVITGSDQLWSPAGLPTNYYNLMFAPEEMRKVSWASSFGVSRIPWYQKKRTKEFLDRIQFVSMRENRGAEIVKELTGRDVPVLMDPVFVFDKDAWEEMIPCKEPEWSSYIFCYFLGNNPEHRRAAKELAERTGRKIVTLRHLDRYVADDENFGDYAPYDVDPARFLNILRNADYVCTDSFHGLAFSVLCEKQFLAFNRYSDKSANSKNSRIESVCKNLNLEGRRYLGDKDVVAAMTAEIDYNKVRSLVGHYRDKTKNYLITALMNED